MSDPFKDQLEAASNDARRRLTKTATRLGWTPGQISDLKDMAWCDRTMGERLVKAAENAQVRWCRHINPRAPRPAALFAWEQPFSIRCPDCVGGAPILTGDADRTCDVCGFVEPVTIRTHQMTMGPVIVSFGVCHQCWGRAD